MLVESTVIRPPPLKTCRIGCRLLASQRTQPNLVPMALIRFISLALLLAIIASIWGLRWALGVDLSKLAEPGSFGEGSLPIFVVIYAVLCIAGAPTLPLNLVAGAAWGTLGGAAVSCVGAILGSLVTFVVARYIFGRPLATPSVNAVISRIQSSFEKGGWKFVVFTRINPIFPSFILNYGFALTSLRLVPYLVATAAGLLLPSIAVAWIGQHLHSLFTDVSPGRVLNVALVISAGVTALWAMRFFARIVLAEKGVG